MSMQMISDEMHSDTTAIRRKKYNLKSGKFKLSLIVLLFKKRRKDLSHIPTKTDVQWC